MNMAVLLRIHVTVLDSDEVLCEPLEIQVTPSDTAADVVATLIEQLHRDPFVIAPLKHCYLHYDRRLHHRVDGQTRGLQWKNKRNSTSMRPVEFWFSVNDDDVRVAKRWRHATSPLEPLDCAVDAKIWLFPKSYACVAGGGPPFQDLWFYRRGVCDRALAFLTEHVLPHDGGAAWLIGPAGGSKTTTAMAFAFPLTQLQQQSNPWVVTWLQPGAVLGPPQLWQFADGRCKHVCLRDPTGANDDPVTVEDLEAALRDVALTDRNHLLVVDGVLSSHPHLVQACEQWLLAARATRRLVVTSHRQSRELLAKSYARLPHLSVFFVSSWTLDEYVAAVAYPPFFDSVQYKLDASDLTVDGQVVPPEDRVRAKFYYTGGNARFMFRMTTNQVCFLDQGLHTDEEDDGYFSVYARDTHSERVIIPLRESVERVLVPRWAVEIALYPWFCEQLVWRLDPLDSEVSRANGTMLETFVRTHPWHELRFTRLKDGSVVDSSQWLYDEDECQAVASGHIPLEITRFPRLWHEPTRRCCGGYDFVLFSEFKRGPVRFVQLARPDHAQTIHWGYFHAFLEQLERAGSRLLVERIEVFVVLAPWQVESYRVTKTTGKPLTKEIQYVRVEPCWREWRDAATIITSPTSSTE